MRKWNATSQAERKRINILSRQWATESSVIFTCVKVTWHQLLTPHSQDTEAPRVSLGDGVSSISCKLYITKRALVTCDIPWLKFTHFPYKRRAGRWRWGDLLLTWKRKITEFLWYPGFQRHTTLMVIINFMEETRLPALESLPRTQWHQKQLHQRSCLSPAWCLLCTWDCPGHFVCCGPELQTSPHFP